MLTKLSRLLVFLLLLQTIYSCSKLELIEPAGIETSIAADSIIFAVIGDYGFAGTPEKQVAEMVKGWNPDFIITTGDNNYNNGEISTIKKNISQYYSTYIYNFDAPREFRCKGKASIEKINRFFPSPGNHDEDNEDKLIPYLNFFTLPGNETYYKFTWGPVSFFSLNSVSGNTDEQMLWLEQMLSESASSFNIVYFHHSPYSSGPHGNNLAMQWNYYSMGVDVVFTGHDHIYNRIEKTGEEGLYYIVNGLGGMNIYECDTIPLPSDLFSTFCYNQDYGAIKVTATNAKMIISFYSVNSPAIPVDQLVINK